MSDEISVDPLIDDLAYDNTFKDKVCGNGF